MDFTISLVPDKAYLIGTVRLNQPARLWANVSEAIKDIENYRKLLPPPEKSKS